MVKNLGEKLHIKFNIYGPYKNSGHLSENAKPVYRASTSSIEDGYKFLRTIKPNIKNGDDGYGKVR